MARYGGSREGHGLSPVTLAEDRRALGRLLAWIETHRLALADVTAARMNRYVVQMRRRRYWRAGRWRSRALSSVQGEVSTLHAFFRYLVDEGVLLFDPVRGIHIPRGRALVARRTFREDEVEAIFAVLDDDGEPGVVRDRALVALLYGGGLRVGEVAAPDLSDYDPDAGVVFVRNGKGGKDRAIPVGPRTCRDVDVYLTGTRPELVGDPDEPALLLHAWGGRMSTQVARLRVKRLQAKAGIQPVRGPHAFRHAFATHLLRHGASLPALSRLLGHACLSTTAVYTEVDVEDLRRVLARAHPRERRRR